MPQRVVRVILEGYACCGVPLGMLLAKALLGISSESQLLALPQLHDEDVCGKAHSHLRRQQRRNERAGHTWAKVGIFSAQEDVTRCYGSLGFIEGLISVPRVAGKHLAKVKGVAHIPRGTAQAPRQQRTAQHFAPLLSLSSHKERKALSGTGL